MNPQQARIYIANLFSCAFNRGKFLEFTRNLLNDNFDENKATVWPKKYIKDAFKPFVNHYERLGTYTAPDDEKLDVLVVHLTNDAQLERARTALRNFIADHLKQRNEKDAALVAFVSPSEQQWRFSYVKMEYSAIETAAGTVGIKTQLTPARRSSYLVGANESCHTAQSRFIGLLQEVRRTPTLTEIEEAFSVEAVTKEFFKQYVQLFNQCEAALAELISNDAALAAEFTRAQINPVEFIKKLLGQLVFLYFLQKKGWLGVAKDGNWGSGARDFLRQLTNGAHGQYTNLFNDVLEPLLYDTLATDRGHAVWCAQFNCRLPFLNGGLFEPLGNYHWREVDVLLPNELFTNNERTAAGDVGTGIFDVFDRYNFTVNEAEPLEKDVAIDPEMLGKVFENLIEDNRRKGLGAYYTPREIVHYMCQESLINYLETQLNTPELTAVPRADLETLVRAGEQLVNYESVKTHYAGREMPAAIQRHAKLIDVALAAMTVCDPAVGSGAFPVGMMTEIVRVRLALTPYFNTALPRSAYLFKRHAIQHCLYGVDIDPGAVEIAKLRLWLSLVVDEVNVQQIKPLPNLDYKIVVGNSLLGVSKDLFNEALFRQLETLKPRYFDESDRDQKAQYRREIEAIIQQLTNGKATFDFEIYFSEVFHYKKGFDVLIANPPYVRQEKIKTLKPALKTAGYECFNGTADLLVYFYERAVKLLRAGGSIAFITSNKYYRAGYGKALRSFLPRELTLHQLIDFGDAPVFEAIAYASILTGTRSPPAPESALLGYTWNQDLQLERITQTISERGQQIAQHELKPDGWQLESPVVFRLLEKLRKAGQPLGEYVGGRLYYGIKTGFNEAFVIDRATRDRLIQEHESSAEMIKPFLRGRDVKKWRTEPQNLWLIFTRRGIDIKKYPAIQKHLIQFKHGLEKRAGNQAWYELQASPGDMIRFEQPKIVIPAIANNAAYAIDCEKHFSNDKTSICITNEPNYLLGLLNSKVLWWFICRVAASKQGGFYELKPMYISSLPIPAASPERQQPIELFVDQILAAKANNPKADTSALEREIDQLVYALYELTPDEIAIVEGAGKS
ncbi:Eco57I restriction-modification methylase domain-containing protein [Thiospirillum jenense]|uniref:site-specific DNA-methyltransferase (adenine-specific) n=1 Tax=Thiospirillum jenense TaxID=1653858 RepID=A0A839HGJ4_9GAMM|nr:TaqI-like C-terminal specificity domain-containing protein [Thiospirillum jenense]MBB1125422.1 Eco57I restriction-modification methylase domain-containing protein [Thiospirillum jenense]